MRKQSETKVKKELTRQEWKQIYKLHVYKLHVLTEGCY
jgi:uncharacterized protein YjlB